MTDIPSNSFAAACFDQNTVAELKEALQGAADEGDCKAWNITPEQWREQVLIALAEKMAGMAPSPIDITDIVKNVHTDTHGNREYPQRFIAWADDVVVGAAESVEGIQADVIHCCGQAGIEVPASVLVWDQGQTPSPIDITTLDPALASDIAGEEGFQAFEAEYPGATVSNQRYHIAFNADAGRGGIVFVGSGSSGETFWTDAESPTEVLSRFLSDDMRP